MPDLPALQAANYGFDLSNREIASLIYIGLLLAALLLWEKGRNSFGAVIKAFFSPALSKIWSLMTLYTIACVALLSAVNAWEWSNLKTTLLWWITFGFASMWESQKISEERGAFRRLVRETINITAVIMFIAEINSFPLWGEMIMLPVITLLGLILVMAQMKREHSVLVGPLTTLMAIIFLAILSNGIGGIIRDPENFFAWNTVREFASPIILSLMFLPFLYGLAIWMTHESIFTRAKAFGADAPNNGYARRRALFAFGMDIEGTKRFSRKLRTDAISDRAGIDAAIREIKMLKARERAPPSVDTSQGWSPYVVMTWLNGHGIMTHDWHGSAFDDEWTAAAYSVAIGERPLPDRISYYITGTEFAATRLRLALDASTPNDPQESDAAFFEMVRTLLAHAFSDDRADALLARIRTQDAHEFEEDGLRVIVEWHGIGERASFGHQRNVKIIHPAHAGEV